MSDITARPAPNLLNNGLVILNVSPYWQPIVVAIILVASVFFDQLAKKRRR